MPSRREIVRMTPDEIQAYLASRSRIIVVTNGLNGLPHPVPMNFGVDAEGRILVTTFRKSQKVKNLERDPRATLLIESGADYAQLKSVIVYADAEIIYDTDVIASGIQSICADDMLTGSLTESMSEQVRTSLTKRALVRFTPFRYVSWDHSKLGGFY